MPQREYTLEEMQRYIDTVVSKKYIAPLLCELMLVQAVKMLKAQAAT